MSRQSWLAQLRAAGVEDAERDLRVLFRAAFEVGQIGPPQTSDAPNEVTDEMFGIYVRQRLERKPVSQIIGRRAFWRHEFHVTSDVLDPRPDTETLVEVALQQPFQRVLDLGTGSGCILISLLADRPEASGLGVDLSASALRVAEKNAHAIGVADRTTWSQGSWFEDVKGTFDLIVSNPPYIPQGDISGLQPEVRDHEPHMALTDGGDGLSVYRQICACASDFLQAKGRLIMEFGIGQWPDIEQIAKQAGWQDVTCHDDLTGRPRVLVAQNPQSSDFSA